MKLETDDIAEAFVTANRCEREQMAWGALKLATLPMAALFFAAVAMKSFAPPESDQATNFNADALESSLHLPSNE